VLQEHPLNVSAQLDSPVRLDVRVTATALAHLLENAAQYSPASSHDPCDRAADSGRVRYPGTRPRARDPAARPSAPVSAVLPWCDRKENPARNWVGSLDHRTAPCGSKRSRVGGELSGWRCTIHHRRPDKRTTTRLRLSFT
jgi:hypothetical protein